MPAPHPPQLKLTSSTLYDALILGAGPAGLSAALALCRVKRPVAIFSTPTFRNDKAHRVHNVLGHDHIPPADIRPKGRKDIEKYGTAKIVEHAVVGARKVEEEKLFEVQDASGETWRGRKIVLAMGVKDVFPQIDGYEDCWGGDIYQCLFCDGLERSDRPAGMLGWNGAMDLHNVSMQMQLGCPKVTVFTNRKLVLDETAQKALESAKAKGATVDERRIERPVHLKDGQGIEIQFHDGPEERVGFLSHVPPSVVHAQEILRGLGIEIASNAFGGTCVQRSEPFGETNLKGVFAAGDVGSPMAKAVALAMCHGMLAGGGVSFSILADEK